MTLTLELVLVSGGRRSVRLPSHTGSVTTQLDRLGDWIETADGGWVQKCHIVEIRVGDSGGEHQEGSAEELRQLDTAAGQLAQAGIKGGSTPAR
jgi:hypothetical protein